MNCYRYIILIAFVNILIIVFAGCEDFMVFEAPSEYNNDGSLASFFKNDKKHGRKPQSPKIRVSQGEYGNKIVIAWQEVENADYYSISRRKKPQKKKTAVPFIPIKKFVPKERTSYPDVFDIKNENFNNLNATYQYKVDAVTSKGQRNTSLPSADAYLLLPPRGLKATKNFPTITLTWEKSRGAQYYKVYRSDSENSFRTNRTELSSHIGKTLRRFVDRNTNLVFGQKYYYHVVSVNASGTESILNAYFPPVMGIRIKSSAPKPPKKVSASKAKFLSKIEVTWDAVRPRDNTNDILYNVFRISSESSRIISIAKEIGESMHNDEHSLKENVDYHYYVQAVEIFSDGGKLEGGYSADIESSLEENSQTGYVLSSSKLVKARRVNKNIHLTWTKAKKATAYKIYVSDSRNGSYNELEEVGDVNAYTHSGALSSSELSMKFYKVLAVNGDIVTPLENAQASTPIPDTPEGVAASMNFYDTRVDDYTEFSGDIYPIKVTWNKAWGAESYVLWRADQKYSDYSIIEDDITQTTAYDTDTIAMEAGKYYYYKVSSKSAKQSSEQSTASRGYGALSNLELAQQWYKTIKSSHGKLELMHKSGMGALGEEQKSGSVKGRVDYEAKPGLKVTVVNTYREYADNSFLTIDGSNTTKVGLIFLNGEQTANYKITGMYTATIEADLKISSAIASGGHYTIEQNNGVPQGTIAYDEVN